MNAIKWLVLSLALILSAVVAAPAAARTPHTSCADNAPDSRLSKRFA